MTGLTGLPHRIMAPSSATSLQSICTTTHERVSKHNSNRKSNIKTLVELSPEHHIFKVTIWELIVESGGDQVFFTFNDPFFHSPVTTIDELSDPTHNVSRSICPGADSYLPVDFSFPLLCKNWSWIGPSAAVIFSGSMMGTDLLHPSLQSQ